MNKMKKIMVSIIIGMVSILGFYTAVNGSEYQPGDKLFSVWQSRYGNHNWEGDADIIYQERNDVFCVQRGQQLMSNKKYQYYLDSQVTIEGNASGGEKTEAWENAQLAYILSHVNKVEKEEVQNAVWNAIRGWAKVVGYRYGIKESEVTGQAGDYSYLYEESKAYADNYKSNRSMSDNTDKSKISVVPYKKDDNAYMKIGPFNWSFSGNMQGVTIYDENNVAINHDNILYSSYEGTEEHWFGVDGIKSGNDFYISIPMNRGISKISKITVQRAIDIKKVVISFLRSVTDEMQNLIIAEPSEAKENIETSFDYDIPMSGDLKVVKVDADNHKTKLEGVKFYIQNVDTGRYVQQPKKDGKISYIESKEGATQFKTDENGEISIKDLLVGNYIAVEIETNYGYELKEEDTKIIIKSGETNQVTIENKRTIGDLEVVKVDADNTNIKLRGVGFYIQYSNTGEYVKQDANGNITYVKEKKKATEFITDNNGKITIKNLLIGDYIAYETKNPNYGYKLDEDGIVVKVKAGKTEEEIPNKQVYVKLSGYVWVDKQDGKMPARNDLYKTKSDLLPDGNDILFNGITVRLKDRTTNKVVQETKTAKLNRYTDYGNDGNGEYLFTDVLIEKLKDYYIEFEYDGLTYTNVVPHIDKDTGSKSAEAQETRKEFNNNFSVVEGDTRNTGYTRNTNGDKVHTLSYNISETEHEATLINNGQYTITANTDVPNYSIKEHFTAGQEEIKFINLGLYEREKPNIAILKDLENVRLSINGQEHTYVYAQRFRNEGEYGDGFNVGVRYSSKYQNMTYTRAIYKADYEYTNEKDKSKELKVYVTYQIAMANKSSNLNVKVNSIVDYYDSNYDLVKVGTKLDGRGEVIEDIEHEETNYDENYKKSIIKNNTTIGKEQESIYVQFALNREAVINILNGKENLDNVAEINSYSVYDGDEIYAGIDKNSNPGNCIPGKKETYEDDTDSSPDLILEVADAREIAGKVFLDETSKELMTGKVRQGSGAYEEGEKGIQGVEVTLTETTGSGKVYKETTDENGDFVISNYIPGNYTLTYTWGDTTYTVQNYKGTVYDSQRDQTNKKWYKEKVETRLTDAMDNWDTRQKIDEELKEVTNATSITIHKMDSTTPVMELGVEYDTTYTASMGDRYTYRISNIDFGIVERPRQDLALTKRVKTFKATLQRGDKIVDLEIDEQGNITGDRKNITYMKPDSNLIQNKNGFIRLELDNESIQGTIVELGYEIKATNQSELDYSSEKFYFYGIPEGDVVTIQPTAIIDYLDNQWAFDRDKNPDWQVKTIDDIKDLVAEVVYDNEESTINEKRILYTDSLKEKKLEPTESAEVMLNVSKVMTTTDEISLDNETEIAKVKKTGGSNIQSTPGNYVPGTGSTESDDSIAETTIVTPNTGDNKDYVLPIVIGATALIMLGAGVIVIKKKVI